MFIPRFFRQAYAKYMAQDPFTTELLHCDPLSISFPTLSDQPSISSQDTAQALHTAARHLVQAKHTVVFPTETVYGLGALALDPLAAAKIFQTKGRPPDNPLIVHVSSMTMLQSILPHGYDIPSVYHILIKRFWPGALTLLFPRNPDVVPTIITANQPTVAIRMPSHPVARALIAISDAPLAAPSANTSGKPSPTKAEHVFRDLNGKIPLILDGGACGVGLESTVVDALHEDGNIRVLRPGGITVEDIEQALRDATPSGAVLPKVLVHKRDYADTAIEAAPTTPGMKYRHYSPSVPVTLLLTQSASGERVTFTNHIRQLRDTTSARPKIGILAPTDSRLWHEIDQLSDIDWHRFDLGPSTDPSTIAYRLFDGLLSLEQAGVEQMFIEEIAEDREGLAIMNRVRKAAGESLPIRYLD